MSDTYNSNRPAAGKPRSPKTWDFMETTFVALIAYAVFLLTAGFGVSIILLVQYGVEDLSPSLYRAIAMRGHWYGAALIIAFAPTLAVLWVAI